MNKDGYASLRVQVEGAAVLPPDNPPRKTTVVNGRETACDIFVGRPSKYGNPYVIGRDGTREECIAKFRDLVKYDRDFIAEIRKHLKGKVLGCYCKPLPCHADVLAEFADADSL